MFSIVSHSSISSAAFSVTVGLGGAWPFDYAGCVGVTVRPRRTLPFDFIDDTVFGGGSADLRLSTTSSARLVVHVYRRWHVLRS